MAAEGFVISKNDVKKYLTEANKDYNNRKVWENLYSNADLIEQKGLSSAKNAYSTNVNDAYAKAFDARQQIMNSNLGQGYKNSAIDNTEEIFTQAYDAYRQNYLQQVSDMQARGEQMSQGITKQLDETSENSLALMDATYNKLKYDFDMYAEGDDKDNIFKNNMLWKRYTVVDEDGNVRLKTKEELIRGDINANNGLYDTKTGNITAKGKDFYDQVFNQMAYEGTGESFGSWLSRTNPELYNWAYDYNKVTGEQNFGGVKEMVGLDSMDNDYTFLERFGGLTEEEVNKSFETFNNKLSEIDSIIREHHGGDTAKVQNAISSAINDLKKYTDDLGITKSLEKSMGKTFDELIGDYANVFRTAKSKNEIINDAVASTGFGTGAGAIGAGGGMAVGKLFGTGTTLALTKAGSAAGPIGTLIGALIGLTISGVSSGIAAGKQKDYNLGLEYQAKHIYADLLANLTKFAQDERIKRQS